jgi:thioredoxin reductase (NADPH)
VYQSEQVIIIGGGPAGMAAGIQLKRFGFDPLLIERGKLGGLLRNAYWVENYPGFPSGIPGLGLVHLFEDQVTRMGVRSARLNVKRVWRSAEGFHVETDKGEFVSRAVVIASGTVPKPVDFLGECDPTRVFYEVKDLPPERMNRVAIVGGGDAAFDYALGLALKGSHVHIFFRSEYPKALPLLVERANRVFRIQIHAGSSVTRVDDARNALMIHVSGGDRYEVNALLVALGRDPNLGFLDEDILRGMNGKSAVPVPGLLLAGDVQRGLSRQVAIAVGDGVYTAMQIAAFLESTEQG